MAEKQSLVDACCGHVAALAREGTAGKKVELPAVLSLAGRAVVKDYARSLSLVAVTRDA